MERIKKSLSNFFELTRAYALGTTFASCFIVLAASLFHPKFSIVEFLLLTFALCCVHLGANLYDDYIDVRNKLKKGIKLSEINFGSYVPKARLILNGQFSMRKVEIIVSLLFLISAIIGIRFILTQGWQVLMFMLAGGILTLFYPISAKFYLSEVVIGLIYGPLMINGGYYALFGTYDPTLILISFAIFFSTLVLLHTHNLMDYEFDENDGKNTICILLKNKFKALGFLKLLFAFAYGIVIYGVIKGYFCRHTLYVFFTLPIAAKLLSSLKDYINIKDVQFTPRWYYGIFENWKKIQSENTAFYMYRLYLARNFLVLFALFAAIGALG